jgi:hypothetical protein
MKTVKRGLVWAFATFSVIMTFLSESIFSNCCIIKKEIIENSKYFSWLDVVALNITVMKFAVFAGLVVVAFLLSYVYSFIRREKIEGNNYSIVIEYGNLLKKKKGQRLINFDECFTATVGSGTADIKKDTVCGQYLIQNPDLDVQSLIAASGAKPCRRKSKYNNSTCYEPGTIVANGDDLLMAFTRLESNGKSMKFTVEEYLKCLSLLWEEIDNNYNNKDVYIPVLGSGMARFENGTSQSISKQELVDLMIASYKLSPHKLKNKNALHIVCRRSADFSMDKLIK